MSFPVQAPPVRRPELVRAEEFFGDVDELTDDQKVTMQVMLGLDANFNDPQWFAMPGAAAMRVSARPGRG
ncbi:hypothetical protein OOZ19_02995 [Saccharopolyspora sp. NFXS83]|uniref:hypothetical protein n=1 Tax=Saccharopolyspora sp. NFXS83 TaxID=2993560 RepID=UPI00224B674A|nr:hypothetical protein [Saccharopolyspora sp. NFXS83]MCX2729195.1 hypothetical protein [Saccharopolyspora sp. NFXS83]